MPGWLPVLPVAGSIIPEHGVWDSSWSLWVFQFTFILLLHLFLLLCFPLEGRSASALAQPCKPSVPVCATSVVTFGGSSVPLPW